MWILEDFQTHETFLLFCGKWIIGRGSTSTIRTITNTVSRQHVSLEVDAEYEPTNPHSVMKITISDMKTKHGSTWNGEPLTVIQLSRKEDHGVLQLSKACSYSLYWEPFAFCFSRVPNSQKKLLQVKLRQLGFHYTPEYQSGLISYLVVSDHLDVTPKILQALIDAVPLVTPLFIESMFTNLTTLKVPEYRKFQPTQECTHIDLLPNSRRKRSLQGYTFHFIHSSSPYLAIVPLAGGVIHSAPYQSTPTYTSPQTHLLVIFADDSISDTSSVDTASLFLNRIIPPEALKWVRKGWIPFAEQELLRSILLEGDLSVMVNLNVQRCSAEMSHVSAEVTSQMHSSIHDGDAGLTRPTSLNTTPKKVMLSLKRPEATQTIDEVEAFFEQLEREKIEPIVSKKLHIAEDEGIESEHEIEHVKETGSISEVVIESPTISGGKGKHFVKKSIKKARDLMPLHAYCKESSFLC